MFALFAAFCVAVVLYLQWKLSYFSRRNIPHLKPHWLKGNLSSILMRTRPLFEDVKECYDQLKAGGHKVVGFYTFTKPNYIAIDPEIVKCVMTNDFQHFMDRGHYYNEKYDPVSAHLLAIEGERWKTLRNKLSPTFTSGKMKLMFPTLIECSGPMVERISELAQNGHSLDVKDIIACFTTYVIGSCAFGLACNSFKYPDAEFRKMGSIIFKTSPYKVLTRILGTSFPNFSRKLGLCVVDSTVAEFIKGIVKETVQQRQKGHLERKDFIQILAELKENLGFTLNEISAQAYLFFAAGFETSSSVITHSLFELAKHQELQDKVRAEICDVLAKNGGKFTYESLSDLKYLEQVIYETLRLYPTVPILTRLCVKPYRIPGTDITINKNTRVLICVQALHHDTEYFSEPEVFNPDRFTNETTETITPYTFLPFGEGPRICIGLRFGIMQSKVGLATILKEFQIFLTPETPKTLEADPNSATVRSTKSDIILRAEPVNWKK